MQRSGFARNPVTQAVPDAPNAEQINSADKRQVQPRGDSKADPWQMTDWDLKTVSACRCVLPSPSLARAENLHQRGLKRLSVHRLEAAKTLQPARVQKSIFEVIG
ncbi:hypothetical protein CKO42_18250 [Lamprobacter modestohalophilus]|uniref:Uncharacterized protein n=1 Tax=Lamprobacter modestohalophilus TaxID=1064514 RepID=A0A9X0WBY1_9GAMM|nr:hypothetical protein [Lamprobacter modestohalophilus]